MPRLEEMYLSGRTEINKSKAKPRQDNDIRRLLDEIQERINIIRQINSKNP